MQTSRGNIHLYNRTQEIIGIDSNSAAPPSSESGIWPSKMRLQKSGLILTLGRICGLVGATVALTFSSLEPSSGGGGGAGGPEGEGGGGGAGTNGGGVPSTGSFVTKIRQGCI